MKMTIKMASATVLVLMAMAEPSLAYATLSPYPLDSSFSSSSSGATTWDSCCIDFGTGGGTNRTERQIIGNALTGWLIV